MPTTRVLKAKPAEATATAAARSNNPRAQRRTAATGTTGATGATGALTLPSARKGRASSCPRCPHTARPVAAPKVAKAHGDANCSGGQGPRRARSTSATESRHRTGREQQQQQQQRRASKHSHKAFTVIPPNPKKRREIQRKAEAELAALEELRLSRAMAYVSISPSSVGGCLSLEEVRLKQQQEMMLAKRKPKPIKQQVMEETPVLTS